jgi:hypothetical protein
MIGQSPWIVAGPAVAKVAKGSNLMKNNQWKSIEVTKLDGNRCCDGHLHFPAPPPAPPPFVRRLLFQNIIKYLKPREDASA